MKTERLKIAILSGAGISAESGISTFRDQNGLWENHDIMEVASITGWIKNPALVLDFYNKRRAQLKQVECNRAHMICALLDNHHDVTIITQNVDDLHERAGSKNIIHLHGELLSARSEFDETIKIRCDGDILPGDLAPDGHQLRPDIVWFGEMVPKLEEAALIVSNCDILIIVGTSLLVYPAAGLINYAFTAKSIYIVDPNLRPKDIPNFNNQRMQLINETAGHGMQLVFDAIT
ncbi:MAG: NAD-dependent deacylase [Saprospiraceae bacterium]|jgi:NAD-dependent deacetylase|nr:MAG: NAD-dependent deacetylase [Candidatus Parvibacillus calidus]MBX2936239.1 NAD-dependent deacylase [Saprospiraceae bacterium]MBK7739054.1 NAD-dependent deacylase [Candidatus Parvibacillus calidus]MBX7179463.1 NAD-dependent deacylase [Saprospiraceae bacterium]MCB0590902.1 NAD-dependent deacylase [Saprospiraceae bacterium]